MVEQPVRFVLSHLSLALPLLALLLGLVAHRRHGATRPLAEELFRWLALVGVFPGCLEAFLVHAFFPEVSARALAWPVSPFQWEVAVANLGVAFLALGAFRAGPGFRAAFVVAAACWFWGAGVGHVAQMVKAKNFSPGNAGIWFWMDVLVPLVLVLLFRAMQKGASMKPATVAAALVVVLPILSAPAASAAQDTTTWTVTGQQVSLNGKPFLAKGVTYAPTPIGGSADYAPFQDWFTAANGFDAIWTRDVPQLREMGSNLVKTYAWWGYLPTTGREWSGAPNNIEKNCLKSLDWSPSGPPADHTPFLDALWNGGRDPVYILIGIGIDAGNVFDNHNSGCAGGDSYYGFYLSTAKWAAQKYGSHPAVLGFVLGNEMNSASRLRDESGFWKKLNEMADAVKLAAPGKLVGVAWQNDGRMFTGEYPLLDDNTHFDFWGANVYSGKTFDEFWTRYGKYVEKGHGKPLLMTEYGMPTGHHEAGKPGPNYVVTESADVNKKVGDWIVSQWQDIVAHRTLTFGGTVFEWCDEWWKVTPSDFAGGRDPNGSDPPRTWLHDASHSRMDDGFPNPWWEEEWWGLNAVAVAAGRDPKHPTDGSGKLVAADVLTRRDAFLRLKQLWTTGQSSQVRPLVETSATAAPFAVPAPLARRVSVESPFHTDALFHASFASAAAHRVTISLSPGAFAGLPAEWFLLHVGPSGTAQYDPATASWRSVTAITPSVVAPLEEMGAVSVPVGILPAGVHLFVFGVDREINGTNDNGHWDVDTDVLVVN